MPVGWRSPDDGDRSPGRQGRRAAVAPLPVARLKAIASRQGLDVFDISESFDPFDPAVIEIAVGDDHPNAVGHRRLFLALARAMVKDEEVYHMLFTPGGK